MSSRKQPHSMRGRLLIWLLAPLISLCAVVTTIAYRLASKCVNDSCDAFIINSGDSTASRLSLLPDGTLAADMPLVVQAIVRHNGSDRFYYQVVDGRGRRLGGNALLPSFVPSFLPSATRLAQD